MFELGSFVELHERALHSFALSLTKSEDESADLLQDTWIKCMGFGTMLENMTEQKQRSWLFTVLKNRWLDILRRRKLERLLRAQINPLPAVKTSAFQFEPLLHKLPEEERKIVVKRYWQGLNSRQIALELDLPEGTVRWKLKLALDKLKKMVMQSNKEEQCQL